MNRLRSLSIENTDINSGVNHLPSNVEEIHYFTKERPESKVKEIEEKLNDFLSKKTNKD